MKNIETLLKFGLPLILLFSMTDAHGQIFKNLGKVAERAAERTLEKRVDKETSEKTDQALDSIFERGDNDQSSQKREKNIPIQKPEENGSIETKSETKKTASLEEEEGVEIGFKRGDKILFRDNFEQDAVGDFPAKWNSNLGGEVKKIKGLDDKFLKITANSVVNLNNNEPFPENFTIELDIIIPEDAPVRIAAIALGANVPNALHYLLTSEEDLRLMFWSNTTEKSRLLKYGSKSDALGYTYKNIDYQYPLNEVIRVAIQVNGSRYRAYINGEKTLDMPSSFKKEFANKFYVSAITHGAKASKQNYFYISNIMITATGQDERSSIIKALLEEGHFSTNEILFAAGSDVIQPTSHQILKEIGDAMAQESSLHFKIVGHTDSDGPESANLSLSKKRAEAVKNSLVYKYNVSADRLSTDGMGETKPVGDNATENGKAQNRRVEFTKQ